MPKIILASKSPRRSFLMEQAGYTFEVKTKDTNEDFPEEMDADLVAEYIAHKKAEDAREFITNDEIVMTADTIVVHDGVIFGKPESRKDALRIVEILAGSMHKVITGVCFISKNQIKSFSDCTEVYINEMTNKEIQDYVDNFKPFDKAGAYAIQEWIGMCKIGRINGSYTNVMGLPMSRVYEELGLFIKGHEEHLKA